MLDYIISRFNSFSLDTEGLTTQNLFERSRKEFQHIPGSNTLVVCLPGWGQELWTWGKVKKQASQHEASFLAYEFPRAILSDQKELTKKCFEMINQTVREDIKKLKEQYGFTRCVLVSISLSSSYSSMIYKDNPDINEIVLVVPGENLARDMWYGCRTEYLRKSYEKQGVNLEQLENAWHDLASENNTPANDTNISMYFGREDRVIPYEYSKTLVDTLSQSGFNLNVKTYNLGHYFLIFKLLLFPKSLLNLTK